jgi:hypothetical protein
MSDLPKIALRRLHEKGAGAHPDPNLLSAFVENSLPGDSREQVLQHIAQCGDCREIVFLSTPDQAATLPTATPSPSNWLTWPVLRWGAAVAAVVVVVAAVSLHHQSGAKYVSSPVVQMTDAPIAKQGPASVPVPEGRREMATAATIAPVPPATKNDSTSNADLQGADQLKKQSATAAASPMAMQLSDAPREKAAKERRDELGKTATVDVVAGQVQVESANVETNQAVPGRAKDATGDAASSIGGGVGAGIGSGAKALQPRVAALGSMGAPRWTLTSDGTLQRSLDFGRTWQTVPVATQASFRALAASGKDIWVGGAKGALYHSTDAGQQWAQVQPVAAGQTLTDDIIGVEFPDALHGELTTANNETWATQDGGQSWSKP